LKTAKIYEPNNLTFLSQINPLFDLFQATLNKEGEALIQLRENTLFFNSIRIKFIFSTFHSFKFITDELRKKEIGKVCFKPGLGKDELKQFIIHLARIEAKKDNAFEDFQAKIKDSGIDHVSLEKIYPFEILGMKQIGQIKQYAKKVFFNSIIHLKEIFDPERLKKEAQLKNTRRLIQLIVDLIILDEAFMVGLTNIKNFDNYTLNHSINVCLLSVSLGKRLGLEKKELVDLGMSAFFHDVGKLEIPKKILEKQSKLNKNERKVIENHPHHGAEKLIHLKERINLPVRALYVALEHHLWVNLSGYPKYWKKKYINLYSKIVKICDFFDAVTTKRPYRKKIFTRSNTINLMLEKSGTEFDSLLLKVFVNMIGAYPIGTFVAIDTGELGIVTEINPEVALMLRPKVKLITDKKGKKIDGEIVDFTEMKPKTKKYKRTIIKTLDPFKYKINIADYFIAQGE